MFDLNSTTTATADQVIVDGLTTINSSALFTFNAIGDSSGLTVNQTFTVLGGLGGITGQFSNLAPNE
ncbi:MAG: hypothetical protein QOD99_2237 [Chthoniobacter sp.]|nr:hypothetical protein [Chthoniobacter sp.]